MGDVLNFTEWSNEVRHRKAGRTHRAPRVELTARDIMRHQAAAGQFAPTPTRRPVSIKIRNAEHGEATQAHEEPHSIVEEPIFQGLVKWFVWEPLKQFWSTCLRRLER